MSHLIKICGLKYPDNIRQILSLEPDIIGLIFYPQSPRFVDVPEKLTPILQHRKNVALAGVFVNETVSRILHLHELLDFDFIQLHGAESPRLIQTLRNNGLKIIKAIGIQSVHDLRETKKYEGIANYLLFDTKVSGYGGSGRKFDWQLLEKYNGETPFFLSGGIQPEDFPQVNHPLFAGVDINSGFEEKPGVKNIPLVENFVNKLRQ